MRLSPTPMAEGHRPARGSGLLCERLREGLRDRKAWMRLPEGPEREYVYSELGGARPMAQDLGFIGLVCLPTPSISELEGWFRLLAGAINPGGALMAAALGPGTLLAWRRALGLPAEAEPRGLDLHDLGDLLSRAGLAAPVTESERLALSYRKFETVLGDLRGLWPCRLAGLRGRSVLTRLEAQFDQMRGPEGRVSLEFELVFAHGWQGRPRASAEGPREQPLTFKAKGRFG